MKRKRLRHLVVLLPGITGSVLQKDGKDVWAFSSSAVSSVLFGRREYLETLKLSSQDDPDLDDLGDGIQATAIMPDSVLIPGFFKLIKGYSGLSLMVRSSFDVVGHGLQSEEPTNLIEFPYDWRRDNRAIARRLHRVIEDRLHRWRGYTQDAEAKVILVAHSMGGLVARHHLEVLEGWRDCLALISFGTPYRGSLNSLNFLANGYRKATLDLTACLRSFTSTYQLLPTYPVVDDGTGFQYLERVEIPGVSAEQVAAAATFHTAISDRVRAHQSDPDYVAHGYRILPFVGTRQPTLQSALWRDGRLTTSQALPPWVNENLEAGDGTVPRYSAVPDEIENQFRETFLAEKHGALQASPIILQDVLGRLQQMQVPHIKRIRGPEISTEGAALSLDIDDLYLPGESVRFQVNLINCLDAAKVIGEVTRAGEAKQFPLAVQFKKIGDHWEGQAQNLTPGFYVLQVYTDRPYPIGPPAVHDLFAVA